MDDNCWPFQEMYGQVFGRVAAIINFHRIQRLLVAMVRRWLLVLCSSITTAYLCKTWQQPKAGDNDMSVPCFKSLDSPCRSLNKSICATTQTPLA